MGYYNILEEIERLHSNKVDSFTVKEVASNVGITNRCASKVFNKLVKEDKIERITIFEKSKKIVYYKVKKQDKTEEFINGIFKVIAGIIH